MPPYEELLALIAALRAELDQARSETSQVRSELMGALAELRTVRVELEASRAKVVELQARLGKNSRNSSKPPSSDPPGTSGPKGPGGKPGKRRKRGGQPGHPGRFAGTPARIDRVHSYRPSHCGRCQVPLASSPATGDVQHHYVYDLPPIEPVVTDHQRVSVQCTACQHVSWGEPPADVPRGQYGASVQAMVALVRGELRQSVRQTSAVLTHLLHVPMSTGMVCKVQELVSLALARPHQEALEHVQQSERVHADETGWRQDKQRAWLWVALSATVTVFIVHANRSTQAAQVLLGAGFSGILASDRWSAYTWIAAARRQLCWSHLKRDFISFLDYGPDAKSLGKRLLVQRRALFRLWYRYRAQELTREELQEQCAPVRQRIEALLEEGSVFSCKKVRGMCRQMLKLRAALFTFIDQPDVEPTNNAAERAIRFAVLMRKGCFGSDSVLGSRFIERFLTARATLRMQRRDLYGFLQESCAAAITRTAPPSLLPAPALQDLAVRAAA